MNILKKLALLSTLLVFTLTLQNRALADPPAGRYRGPSTKSKNSKVDIKLKPSNLGLSASGTVSLSGLEFKVKGKVLDGTNTFFGTATYTKPDGSKDRRSLTGSYDALGRIFVFEIKIRPSGKAVFNATTRTDRCSEFIGFWAWFTGGVVNVNANNTMSTTNESQGTISGTWECTHVNGSFILVWENGLYIDTLKLSEDGNSINGTNQDGTTVTGTKL